MTDYETFYENLVRVPWFTPEKDPSQAHRRKAAPILYTFILLHNNHQKHEDKIYSIDKSSRNKFNKTQLHSANRVIQAIRSLQGYNYPRRFSIIDRDPEKAEGDRFCFLFSNQIDTETETYTEVTDTQLTDTQTSFTVQDSRNSKVLTSADENSSDGGERRSMNDLMEHLKDNIDKSYPKFVKLRVFFQVLKSDIESSSQLDQVTRDSRMYADSLSKNHCYKKDLARAVGDVGKGEVRFEKMDNDWKFGMAKQVCNTKSPEKRTGNTESEKLSNPIPNRSPLQTKIQTIIKSHTEFLKKREESIIHLSSESESIVSQNSVPKPPTQFAIKSQYSKPAESQSQKSRPTKTSKSSMISTSQQQIRSKNMNMPEKLNVPETPEFRSLLKSQLNKSINQSSFITNQNFGIYQTEPTKINDTPRLIRDLPQPVMQTSSQKLKFQDISDTVAGLKKTFGSNNETDISVAGFDDKATQSKATFFVNENQEK